MKNKKQRVIHSPKALAYGGAWPAGIRLAAAAAVQPDQVGRCYHAAEAVVGSSGQVLAVSEQTIRGLDFGGAYTRIAGYQNTGYGHIPRGLQVSYGMSSGSKDPSEVQTLS